jgi:hypothetical protein
MRGLVITCILIGLLETAVAFSVNQQVPTKVLVTGAGEFVLPVFEEK